MYKLLDIVLIIVLLIGLLFNNRIKLCNKKKELPYIVMVYLAAAPYRGYIATNMPYVDLMIDIILLLYFCVLCVQSRIAICSNYMVWLVGFLTSATLYSCSTTGILGIIRIQEVKFYIGITLLLTIITIKLKSKEGIFDIIRIYIVNSIIISVADIISFIIYKNCIFCDILSNRNFVSIYSFLGLLGLLYLYRSTRKVKILVAIVVVLLDLLLMKSSSVYIAIFSLLCIWILRKLYCTSRGMYRLIIALFGIAVVITIIIVASPLASKNGVVMAIQNMRSSQDYTRTLIWDEALSLAKDNMIFGIGPDKFRDTRTGYKFPTHNDYIKVLTETGLIGLCAFVTFLISTFKDLLRIQDKRVKRYVFCAILGLLIFILFHGYINYVTFWIVLSIPYWWRYYVEREKKRGV